MNLPRATGQFAICRVELDWPLLEVDRIRLHVQSSGVTVQGVGQVLVTLHVPLSRSLVSHCW